jgi:hypothetical protein
MKRITPKTLNLLPDEMEALARIHADRQIRSMRGEMAPREATISRSVGEALKAYAASLPRRKGRAK